MSARRIHGFTLIEVVIALAILGLSLSVLYGAFENALVRTHRDARFSEATMIAQSLLARAGSELPSAQGTYRGDWNGYGYQLTQEQVRAPDRQPMFTVPTLRVTAKVWWDSSKEIQISTLELASKADR